MERKMKMRRTHDSIRMMCIVACFGCAALQVSCTRTKLPNSGLTNEELNVSSTQLLRNGMLEWVIVIPQGASMPDEDFALVTVDGSTHLFQIYERADGRILKVLPVGVTPVSWVRDAASRSSTGLDVRYLSREELAALEEGSLGVPLGYATIEGGRVTALSWLGQPPEAGDWGVALLSTEPAKQGALLDARVRGVARYLSEKKDELVAMAESSLPDGSYFVLLDGQELTPLEEQAYRVGVVGSKQGEPQKVGQIELFPVSLPRELLEGNEVALREVALTLGVDAITWREGDAFRLMAVDLFDERITRDGVGLKPGLIEVSLGFETQKDLLKGAHALDAIRKGHALDAYAALDGIDIEVEKSSSVGRLRHQELLGAAGLAQWLYADRKGTTRREFLAPEFIYLSRAYLFSGAPRDALVMADGARQAWDNWSDVGRRVAMGRSFELMGQAHAMLGDYKEAITHLQQAVEYYKREEVGDSVAAAEAEVLMSAFALRGGSEDVALAEGKRARSRYYYANDFFSCAQTELELADLYLRLGLDKDAMDTTGYGALRMKEIDHPVGLNRAALMNAFISHQIKPGSVRIDDVRQAYTTAKTQRDGWGELMGASTMVLLGGMFDTSEAAMLGADLERGQHQFDAGVMRDHAERALASLCAQGYRPKTSGGAPRANDCELLIAKYQPEGELVRSWVIQGYAHLLRGQNEDVKSSRERLEKLRDGDVYLKDKALAAYIELYLASIAYAASEEAARKEHVDRAYRLIGELDAEQQAIVLYETALDLEQRGQQHLLAPLLSGAFDVARTRKQEERARDIAMKYAEVLRQDRKLEEALAAIEQAASRVSKDEDASLRTRLAFDRALINSMRKVSSAQSEWTLAYEAASKLEPIAALEVLSHALEVSLEEAKGVQSEELLEKITRVEAGMTPSLVSTLEGKRALARSEQLRAEDAVARGDVARAIKLATSAEKTLADDPSAQASETRARSLLLLARYAQSASQNESVEQRLEELWARQLDALDRRLFSTSEYEAPIGVARALAEIRYLRGDADGSRAVFSALMLSGVSPTKSYLKIACEQGQHDIIAGDFTRGKEALTQCVELSDGSDLVYRAKVLDALTQESTLDRKRGLQRLLDPRDTRQKTRKQMLLELGVASEESKTGAFERAFKKAQRTFTSSSVSGEVRAQAGVEVVERLIERGELDEAGAQLNELKPLLYDLGQEYPVDYVRLNTALRFARLDVVQSQYYLERASVEFPQGLEPARQIKLDILSARHALALGQWTRARALLGDAYSLAGEEGLTELQRRATSLAEQFQLKL